MSDRFTVDVGRAWADLLTPFNYYRLHTRGFRLDVVCHTGAEIAPGTVIYPQIMAVNGQNTNARRREGGGPVYIGAPSLVVEI